MTTSISIQYESLDTLCTDFDKNLSKGRAFVEGATVELEKVKNERQLCVLTIVHPDTGQQLLLDAEAVWLSPAGVGLEFRNFSEPMRHLLALFVQRPAAPEERSTPEINVQGDLAAVESQEVERNDFATEEIPATSQSRNLYDRVRNLSTAERDQLAR